MTDERQKKTTEEYRSNWDSIFKKKKEEHCCNQECNQGRDCPKRKEQND